MPPRPLVCARRLLPAALALLPAALACGPADTPAGAPQPSARPIAAPTASAAASAAPKPPEIERADVDALVTRWLDTQNRSDFEGYEALYEARFTGVKRTGERTRAFDRAGWLRDRRRMFERGQVVAIEDVVVRSTPTTAEVTFTQRWTSGTYADVGPKRLVLVRAGDALRISREELLASSVRPTIEAALALGSFVALEGGSRPLVVLGPADASVAAGTPTLLGDGEPFVVGRPIRPGAAPAVEALLGTSVTAIGRRTSCPAVVRALSVARLVVPHFGTVAAWNGDDVGDGPTTPRTPHERAEELWTMGSRASFVAELETACDGVIAAVTTDAVEVAVPRPPTPDERQRLLASFERTVRHRAREDAYRAFLGDGGGDEEHPPPPAQRAGWREAASVVVFERAGRAHATVVHNPEGCGGFDVGAWASFDLDGGRPVEHRGGDDAVTSIMAVFDRDRDGTVEAVVRRSLSGYGIVRLGPGYVPLVVVEVDDFDCPC